MGRRNRCKVEPVECEVEKACTENPFDNIICLIIVLIVLQFLCALLCGECNDSC